MKIYYKGNKLTEILILSVAILVAVVVLRKSIWLIFPYVLLEIAVLYSLSNFHYLFENQSIKIRYGFYTCKEIPFRSIRKIIIHDKQKGELLTSPHRVEIHYGTDKKQIVCPKETVSFVENIERLLPDVEII